MPGLSAFLLLSSAVIYNNTKKILLIAGKVFAFACFIMGIIGVTIGINNATKNVSNIKLKWGTATLIGIIAVIINFFGAIGSLLIKINITRPHNLDI